MSKLIEIYMTGFGSGSALWRSKSVQNVGEEVMNLLMDRHTVDIRPVIEKALTLAENPDEDDLLRCAALKLVSTVLNAASNAIRGYKQEGSYALSQEFTATAQQKYDSLMSALPDPEQLMTRLLNVAEKGFSDRSNSAAYGSYLIAGNVYAQRLLYRPSEEMEQRAELLKKKYPAAMWEATSKRSFTP